MSVHGTRVWWASALALALIGLACAWLAAQEQAATLSELQRVKAELHQARVQLVQAQAAGANCQAQLEIAKLTTERAALEADFRATLRPPEGATFDWATLRFKLKEKE